MRVEEHHEIGKVSSTNEVAPRRSDAPTHDEAPEGIAGGSRCSRWLLSSLSCCSVLCRAFRRAPR